MIGLREVIGLDMRLHRGSFLLGLGTGAAAVAVVVATVQARQRRMREREDAPYRDGGSTGTPRAEEPSV